MLLSNFFCCFFREGLSDVASWLPVCDIFWIKPEKVVSWNVGATECLHGALRTWIFFVCRFWVVCVCVLCFCCWKRRPLWKKKTLNTPWEHEQIIHMSFAGSNVSQVLCSSVFDRFLFHCGWVGFETMYLLCFAVLGIPVHPRRKNPKEKPCPGRGNPTLKPSCPERNDSKSPLKNRFFEWPISSGQFSGGQETTLLVSMGPGV